MSITQTHPRIRLTEAIVKRLADDPILVSLVEDGEPDNYGARHRIGKVLKESSLKGRTPYVGVQVVNDFPMVPGVSRAHLWRSIVLVWGYSKDEFKATQLIDRVQYLLSSPGDDDCNGFLDFTNQHIKNHGTEMVVREGQSHDAGLDMYADTIQLEVIWSDVPCDLDVELPQTEQCDLPQSADPDTEECLLNFAPTAVDVAEDAVSPHAIGPMSVEGGTEPYSYQVVGGDSRDNFSISGSSLDFVFTGSLTVDDTYAVVVRASDANGNYSDSWLVVTIVPGE